MSPARPTRAQQDADSDKPRMVIDYQGMQVFDCRHRIKVVLGPNPPRGVKGCLRVEGFKLEKDGTWTRPNNPMSILAAQAIGKEFFPSQQETK